MSSPSLTLSTAFPQIPTSRYLSITYTNHTPGHHPANHILLPYSRDLYSRYSSALPPLLSISGSAGLLYHIHYQQATLPLSPSAHSAKTSQAHNNTSAQSTYRKTCSANKDFRSVRGIIIKPSSCTHISEEPKPDDWQPRSPTDYELRAGS